MKRVSARIQLALGLALFTVFAAFSLFPGIIAPYGPKDMSKAWLEPSKDHPLGTNDMGYDIFSELVYASRGTLFSGFLSAGASVCAGTLIGLAAGYFGGLIGEASGIITNVFLLVPMLPAAIVAQSFLGPGIAKTAMVISMFAWCPTARSVRARAAQLKRSDFIEQLAAFQIPKARILFLHILPNLMDVALARGVVSISSCIMAEASLSFIGLGDPSAATWGGMVNLAFHNGGFARGALNWFLAPGAAITLCALAFRLICGYLEYRSTAVKGGVKKSYMG